MIRGRRLRLLLALTLLLLLGGLAIVPSARWPVYSWLRGEAFYDGMPSSYWRQTIVEWLTVGKDEMLEVEFGVVQPSWTVQLQRSAGIAQPPRPRPVILGTGLAAGFAPLGSARARRTPPAVADPTALPVLLVLLGDEEEAVRRQVLLTMRTLGPEAWGAVPVVLGLLGDESEGVRRDAARALLAIDPDAAANAGVK